jgi:hypothetical protein
VYPLAYQKWHSIYMTIYPTSFQRHRGQCREAMSSCEWALERCVAHGQHPSSKGVFGKAATSAVQRRCDVHEGNGQAFFLDFISAWTGMAFAYFAPICSALLHDVAGVHQTAGTSGFGTGQIYPWVMILLDGND